MAKLKLFKMKIIGILTDNELLKELKQGYSKKDIFNQKTINLDGKDFELYLEKTYPNPYQYNSFLK